MLRSSEGGRPPVAAASKEFCPSSDEDDVDDMGPDMNGLTELPCPLEEDSAPSAEAESIIMVFGRFLGCPCCDSDFNCCCWLMRFRIWAIIARAWTSLLEDPLVIPSAAPANSEGESNGTELGVAESPQSPWGLVDW